MWGQGRHWMVKVRKYNIYVCHVIATPLKLGLTGHCVWKKMCINFFIIFCFSFEALIKSPPPPYITRIFPHIKQFKYPFAALVNFSVPPPPSPPPPYLLVMLGLGVPFQPTTPPLFLLPLNSPWLGAYLSVSLKRNCGLEPTYPTI